jgi:ElaB/YqjD/DUF883 family membrane-anchored ribosome-binding protein
MSTREPEQIRADIEETREQLGETVEALAEKADVKGQAKARVDETKAHARARVDETKENLRHRADEAKARISSASPDQAKGAAANVQQTAKEKPLPFAVGGAFAAGLLLGLLLAKRRR